LLGCPEIMRIRRCATCSVSIRPREGFEDALAELSRPDSRLLVIGYGFRDDHVTAAIDKAATQGLKMFVIDPLGARIGYEMNETRKRGQIAAASPVEGLPQRMPWRRQVLRSTAGFLGNLENFPAGSMLGKAASGSWPLAAVYPQGNEPPSPAGRAG
jgi:hypothetical protein